MNKKWNSSHYCVFSVRWNPTAVEHWIPYTTTEREMQELIIIMVISIVVIIMVISVVALIDEKMEIRHLHAFSSSHRACEAVWAGAGAPANGRMHRQPEQGVQAWRQGGRQASQPQPVRGTDHLLPGTQWSRQNHNHVSCGQFLSQLTFWVGGGGGEGEYICVFYIKGYDHVTKKYAVLKKKHTYIWVVFLV